MSRFTDCFQIVMRYEGGHSNDPNDPGGETMYGITRRDHPDAFANGLPTLEQAAEIYQKKYWLAAGCDRLPWPYDLLTFDAAVNQGVGVAIKGLQRALKVKPDGLVGLVTIDACERGGPEGVALVLAERALRYAQTNGFERYGRGWLKRTYLIAMEC